MNKLFIPLVIVLLVLSGLSLNAQHHICGHEIITNSMAQQIPGYQQQVHKIFEEAKRRGETSRLSRNNAVYTIDLVIHVVWKDSSENLATSIIQGQVDQLNKDFRRLNADTANLRAIFHPVASDPMIEFNLAQVIRVQTNEEFEVDLTGTLPDNVKETANGGSDPWDTELYLNLWICKIQPISIGGYTLGQVLGYAYPPDGLPNWPAGTAAPSPLYEGVVVDFRAIGPNNPNFLDPDPNGNVPFINGRTSAHEIGHYLGLRHVWGDGGGIFGGSSCGEDDGVADTPNTGASQGATCDTTANTCSDPPNDLPDMIENYMDYSSEDCMNTFTIGQIDIMRGVLEGPRCKLVNACVTTTNEPTVETLTAVELYPNPAKGVTTLEFDNPNLKEYQITIRDVMGKQVLPVILDSQANPNHTISLNGLANGIYFVEIASKEVTIGRKLVVGQ